MCVGVVSVILVSVSPSPHVTSNLLAVPIAVIVKVTAVPAPAATISATKSTC